MADAEVVLTCGACGDPLYGPELLHSEPGREAEAIRLLRLIADECYIPHHTPSSESGPEEWDVEILPPEIETLEQVVRFLAPPWWAR